MRPKEVGLGKEKVFGEKKVRKLREELGLEGK